MSITVVGKKRPKKIIMPGDIGSTESRKKYKRPSGVYLYGVDDLPDDHPIRKEIEMKTIDQIKVEADRQIAEMGYYKPVESINDVYDMPFKEGQYTAYRMVHGITYVELTDIFRTSGYQIRKLMDFYGITKDQQGNAIVDLTLTEGQTKKVLKKMPKRSAEAKSRVETLRHPQAIYQQPMVQKVDEDVIYRQEIRGRYTEERLLRMIESLEQTVLSQPSGMFEVNLSIVRRDGDIED